MKEKIKKAITAAFVADALSLGVHWEYDTARIKAHYGQIDRMIKPQLVPYHKTKQAGDFTHYGDQMRVLLESVSACGRFDAKDFSDRWQQFFAVYTGYIDHATKETRINLGNGKPYDQAGSSSTDLAGASRIPPLFLFYEGDEAQLLKNVRMQTQMTHNQPEVIATAEWLASAAVRILGGDSPVDAMQDAKKNAARHSPIKKLISRGIAARDAESSDAIKTFGQMCELDAALPGAVHLVARYGADFETAMVENVMAGGDSSARGMLAGFLIACGPEKVHVPDRWLESMRAGPTIVDLLK